MQVEVEKKKRMEAEEKRIDAERKKRERLEKQERELRDRILKNMKVRAGRTGNRERRRKNRGTYAKHHQGDRGEGVAGVGEERDGEGEEHRDGDCEEHRDWRSKQSASRKGTRRQDIQELELERAWRRPGRRENVGGKWGGAEEGRVENK